MVSGKGTFRGDSASREQQIRGSSWTKVERNRAYLFSAFLLLALGGMATGMTHLANNHTVTPVIAVVDAKGHVVQQQVVSMDTITGQESFVQSEVHKFITYCNTFDLAWRQRYADLCRLHSTADVARQYDAETSPENPNNPYYQIGQGGRRYPSITAVTPIARDAYQVSFKSITEKPGSETRTEYFTALVRFTFTGKPLALGDRWENGLGFAATAYRKDQEFSRQ